MKQFLAGLICCLSCCTAFAATPQIEGFRGANSVDVTTNRALGTVTSSLSSNVNVRGTLTSTNTQTYGANTNWGSQYIVGDLTLTNNGFVSLFVGGSTILSNAVIVGNPAWPLASGTTASIFDSYAAINAFRGNTYILGSLARGVTNATGTSPSFDWTGPSIFRHSPVAATTYSFVSTPSAGENYVSTLWIISMATNTAWSLTFPAGINWQGTGPVVLSSFTNMYLIIFDGTNIIGQSLQVAASSGNFASATVTNSFDRGVTNATGTSPTFDWNGPGVFRHSPVAAGTYSFANTPSAGANYRSALWVIQMATNTAWTMTFPSGINWQGNGPTVLATFTNMFLFTFDGTNIIGKSLQDAANANQFDATTTFSLIKAGLSTNWQTFSATNRAEANTAVPLTIAGGLGGTNLTEWKIAVESTNRAYMNSNALLRLPDGSVTQPAIGWANDDDGSGTGLYRSQQDRVGITVNGAGTAAFVGSSFYVLQNIGIGSLSTPNFLIADVSNGYAKFIAGDATSSQITYRIRTLSKTANYTFTDNDSSSWVNNFLSGALITNTLPTGVVGLNYGMHIFAATNMAIKASGSEVIVYGALTTAAGGLIYGAAKGMTLHVTCIKAASTWMVDQVVAPTTAGAITTDWNVQ